MKISIITIVFNDVKNIEKTIISIRDQKIKDLEYIIIDGGSTDGTVEILKQYNDAISYWDSESDKGIVDAFNKGIKKATGDIIGLVNSGDFLEPDTLKKVSEVFESGNADIVYGNMQYWTEKQKEYIYKADHRLLARFMSLNHPAVFVRKEIYNQYGLFDDTYKVAMDYDLMLRFYSEGARFKYIDSVLSNMALGGVSDLNWQLAYRESFNIRKKYLGNSISLYASYLWQVLKRYVSNAVSKLGLEGIKKFYRTYFSSIKKEKS